MSRIGKGEWTILYALVAAVDAGQFIIDFTGIGLAINTFIDPFIGVALGAYVQFRGVSIFKHPTILLSLAGATLLDGFTGGIAPAWFVDVWYIKRVADQEALKEEAKTRQGEFEARDYLYRDGIRQPRIIDAETGEDLAVNVDGVRAPNRGLNRAA